MARSLFTRLLSLSLLLVAPSFKAVAQAARILHENIHSAAMGNRSWGYNVYLPPSYDSGEKRYPVVYVLHGGNSDENGMTFIAKDYVHHYIRNQQLPEFIMVFPNGGRDHFYLDRAVVRQQIENPDTHIMRELIPHIDAKFRTIASKEARAITGFSMGGYGAYHFATKYPDTFSAAAPLAGAGPYGPNGLIVNYSPTEKPEALAVSNADLLRRSSRFYVAVGGNDLVNYNNEMTRILRGQGIPTEYQVLQGVGHDLGTIMNRLGLPIFQHLSADFNQQKDSMEP